MVFLIAGMLAAGAAYLINRQIVKVMGSKGIYALIPMVEEVIKTSLAVGLGASIIGTHFVFGVVEGIYDFLTAGKKRSLAGVVSVVSHFIFGLATATIFSTYGIITAILISTIIHSSWNAIIVRVAEHNQPKKLS